MRVLNMGAGVQTTAILLEFWKRYDYVIFADTGDEKKSTYEYIENYLKPFCQSKNLEWITVKSHKGTLMEHCMKEKIIPIKMRRWCTQDFKVRPIQKKLKELGATAKNPIISDIGISFDESHRANFTNDRKFQVMEYPLLDYKLTRKDCYDIILKHNFPLPEKSGCDFCMFQKRSELRKLALNDPERFEKIVKMEKNSYDYPKRPLVGSFVLDGILNSNTLDEYMEESCDSGHCMV
jgi:3'-phosphoadenosine 5'-phosphosulfate sulfotransferase (PAPS reductase)/FAD synthetase